MRCLALLALSCCALFAAERPQVVITTSMGAITCELFAEQCPRTVENFIALAQGDKEFKDPKTGEVAKRPFFDGLIFHRVIAGFMIQGGCPLGNGSSGPGYSFADEINAKSLGLEEEMCFVGERPNPQCEYMWPQIQQQVIIPAIESKGINRESPQEKIQAAFMTELEALKSLSLRSLYEKLGYHYRDDLPQSSKPLKGYLAMANSGPGTNGSQFFINLADTPHLTGKHTVFGRVISGMDVVEKIGAVPVDEQTAKPNTPVVIESIRLVPEK